MTYRDDKAEPRLPMPRYKPGDLLKYVEVQGLLTAQPGAAVILILDTVGQRDIYPDGWPAEEDGSGCYVILAADEVRTWNCSYVNVRYELLKASDEV